MSRNKLAATWALGLGLLASPALASPYAISHTGVLEESTLPGVISGESYEITLVFDNGVSSTASQTWDGDDLVCVVWRFNDARDVVYSQDMVANPALEVVGTAVTDGAGVLTANFNEVFDEDITGDYTASVVFTPLINWFANDANGIFYDSDYNRDVDDEAGGVQMAANLWTNPAASTSDCASFVSNPVSQVQEIPTLSEWAMILFASILAGGAALMIQRRRPQT